MTGQRGGERGGIAGVTRQTTAGPDQLAVSAYLSCCIDSVAFIPHNIQRLHLPDWLLKTHDSV